jgi:hypothetical protein
MVVIRIRESDDTPISKSVCNDDIKIMQNLRFCKLISTDIDEKIEKKIEYLIVSNPKNMIDYTIFGLQQSQNLSSGRWKRK